MPFDTINNSKALNELSEEKKETVHLNSNLKDETSQTLDDIYSVLKNHVKTGERTLHLGIIKFNKRLRKMTGGINYTSLNFHFIISCSKSLSSITQVLAVQFLVASV